MSLVVGKVTGSVIGAGVGVGFGTGLTTGVSIVNSAPLEFLNMFVLVRSRIIEFPSIFKFAIPLFLALKVIVPNFFDSLTPSVNPAIFINLPVVLFITSDPGAGNAIQPSACLNEITSNSFSEN